MSPNNISNLSNYVLFITPPIPQEKEKSNNLSIVFLENSSSSLGIFSGKTDDLF